MTFLWNISSSDCLSSHAFGLSPLCCVNICVTNPYFRWFLTWSYIYFGEERGTQLHTEREFVLRSDDDDGLWLQGRLESLGKVLPSRSEGSLAMSVLLLSHLCVPQHCDGEAKSVFSSTLMGHLLKSAKSEGLAGWEWPTYGNWVHLLQLLSIEVCRSSLAGREKWTSLCCELVADQLTCEPCWNCLYAVIQYLRLRITIGLSCAELLVKKSPSSK